jgi:type IV fimbrial biogenesis protein FimT
MTPRATLAAGGFTLIELMVTLSIAALLMLVSVPGLTTWKRNAELVSATNTLIASINAARGEAMKRGMNAMVVPAAGSDWNSGWRVFVDVNRDNAWDAADFMVSQQAALPSTILVTGTQSASGSTPYVLFDASGYLKTTAGGFGAVTLSLTRTDLPAATAYTGTRFIKIAQTGRVRSCKPASLADPDCSASLED